MPKMFAALFVMVVLVGAEAQLDYDSNVSIDQGHSAGLRPLSPNGCRAKGFSATTVNDGQKVCRDRLIYVDQFNEVDPSIWQKDVQISDEPDYEFTVYDKDPANLYIERGLLKIKASLLEEKYGQDFVMTGNLDLPECTSSDQNKCSHRAESFDIVPPVLSARISTQKSLRFRYGTVEIRARMPSGDWLYPIITLRPASSVYGAYYASGEVRFPYTVGNRSGRNKLMAGVVLQPPGSVGEPTFFPVEYHNTNNSVSYQRQYHIYLLKWSPDGFQFFVDGNLIGTVTPPEGGWASASALQNGNTAAWLSGTKMAPFDQEFYLSIGLAAGGVTRFPDGVKYPDKPWTNTSPKSMLNFWKARDKWTHSWDSPRLEVAYIKIRSTE